MMVLSPAIVAEGTRAGWDGGVGGVRRRGGLKTLRWEVGRVSQVNESSFEPVVDD